MRNKINIFIVVLYFFLFCINTVVYADDINNKNMYDNYNLFLDNTTIKYNDCEYYKLYFGTDTQAINEIGKLFNQKMSKLEKEINFCYDKNNLSDACVLINNGLEVAYSIDSPNELNDGEIIYYYLSKYRWYYRECDDIVYINFLCDYIVTNYQVQYSDKKLREIVNALNIQNQSDYKKVLEIYKWICSNFTYDYTYEHNTDYLALQYKETTCMGYSIMFEKMTEIAGVESYPITGWVYQINGQPVDSSYHAWNIVKLDNYYYYLDSCWDAMYYGDEKRFEHFLRVDTDKTFSQRIIEKRISSRTLFGKIVPRYNYVITIYFDSKYVKTKSKNVLPGSIVNKPKPKRKNYKLSYWYNTSTGKRVNSKTIYYEPTRLKPKWKKKKK